MLVFESLDVGFELVHQLLLFHIQIISLVDLASVAAIINRVVQLVGRGYLECKSFLAYGVLSSWHLLS